MEHKNGKLFGKVYPETRLIEATCVPTTFFYACHDDALKGDSL